MTELNSLYPSVSRSKKRLGQGHGSGKGKTGGRGTKGQNSRGKVHQTTGSGKLSWIRRMPLFRGKYRNKPVSQKPFPVNVKFLNELTSGSIVDGASLVKFKIIRPEDAENKIKILGDGELTVALTVKLHCSKGARAKIEKAGGKVEFAENPKSN